MAACIHSDEEFNFFLAFFPPQFALTHSLSLEELALQEHEARWSG